MKGFADLMKACNELKRKNKLSNLDLAEELNDIAEYYKGRGRK